ncbi:MAG: ABC transporter ATP-binding protein [Planctomycetota bacterium]
MNLRPMPLAFEIGQMNVVETSGLAKRYGAVQALAGVDLRIPSGSIFGFLGPNGAGKTTTLRILVGLLRASAGTVRVLGRDAWRESTSIRARVGYLSGDVRLYERMTGAALLAFCNQARGGEAAGEASRLVERFEIDVSRRIRDYSRGMKQKLGLILAMMHRPPLLILDEPTTALDPLVRQTLFEELRAVVREGRTVFLSSHTLSEVESLCDHVAIIRAGRLVEDSSIEALRGRALRRVVMRLKSGPASALKLPPGMTGLKCGGETLQASWEGPVEPLLSWLTAIGVADVAIEPPSLEDLFATYYRDGEGTGAKAAGRRAPS